MSATSASRSTARQSITLRRVRKPADQRDVLGHGHPLDQAELLVDEGHRRTRPHVVDALAAQEDLAAVWLVDAGEQLDQRRLAGAIGAQQRVDLALAEVEVNFVHGQRPAEALRHAAKARRMGARSGGIVGAPSVNSPPSARTVSI